MPDPPYSSGTMTPMRPSSPRAATVAEGNSPASSQCRAFGFTSLSTKERTVSRRATCSGASSNFIARRLSGRDEIDVGRLELGVPAELRADVHADLDVFGPGYADEPGEKQRVHTVELDEDQVERRLLQEFLASEIARREGVDAALLGQLHPVGLGPAVRACEARRGVRIPALAAPRPQELLVGESREKRRVLPVAMNVFDGIRILDDDRGHPLEDGQVLRERDVENRRPR